MRTSHTMESGGYRMKKAAHYLACYFSIMGLGFLFACLIMGAVEYLLPLAVFMTGCAVVAVALDPTKSGAYDE